MLIFRPSAQLAKRLKCRITESPRLPPQGRDASSWSGDVFTYRGAGSCAVMMHDATLFTILVPLEGIRSFETFIPRFLMRVAAVWASFGGSFDSLNQNVVVLKRSNRSLIGSMNDAKRLLEGDVLHHLENSGVVNWVQAERRMNIVPYGVINYEGPSHALRKLLTEG